MKVVLDTNIIVSGMFWKGSPSVILEHWYQKNFTFNIFYYKYNPAN